MLTRLVSSCQLRLVCVAMTQDTGWPKGLVATIAAEVTRQRKKRGLSAQKLADRTAELGHAVPRSVLANLENGRRETVSVAELFVLAEALGVPPLWLVFPVGHVAEVEVLPNREITPLNALRWAGGEPDKLGTRRAEPRPYEDELRTIRRHEMHGRAISRWRFARREIEKLGAGTDEESVDRREHYEEQIADAAEMLAYLRFEMRHAGEVLPDVPPELSPAVENYTDEGSRLARMTRLRSRMDEGMDL